MCTKIGIRFSPYGHTYRRYHENKFRMLKQHGYDAFEAESFRLRQWIQDLAAQHYTSL